MLEDEGSYFRHVVQEAVYDLKKNGSAYCFNEQQFKVIKENISCYVYKVEDGIFYLRRSDDVRNGKA